jgi:D-beta-D-heptose 7-phosphate kinase/D-beta-D-heptose 1-phosphate adenosyltransferase
MKKVLVIGDVVVDEYVTCDIQSLTLEAPALAGTIRERVRNIGAAGNIVKNLRALGANVDLVTVCERGQEAQLEAMLGPGAKVFNLSSFFPKYSVPTKTRFVDQRRSIIFRADEPTKTFGDYQADFGSDASFMIDHYNRSYDCIVVAEYLETPLVKSLIPLLQQVRVPVYSNIRPCAHAHQLALLSKLVSVNADEFDSLVHGMIPALKRPNSAIATDVQLLNFSMILSHSRMHFLITMNKEGCVWIDGPNDKVHRFDTIPVEVDNPCGAGDTFFSAVVRRMGEQLTAEDIEFAQAAARVSVQHYETYAPTELEVDLELAEIKAKSKIVMPQNLLGLAMNLHLDKAKIVATNGCFDLLHMGHKSLLDFAKAQGDKLVVFVNTDSTVRAAKGPGRPIQPLATRLANLAYLPCVDYVVPFSEETPEEVIQLLTPDVLVKGQEYVGTIVPGADYVTEKGGELLFAPMLGNLHTTTLLQSAPRVPAVQSEQS